MEEGSHQELWSNSESVYHSLVALQEAATDRRDELANVDIEEIVKQDAELAEEAARESSMQASLKVPDESSKPGEIASRKSLDSRKSLASEKKIGSAEEEKEEELVRAFPCSLLSFCLLQSRLYTGPGCPAVPAEVLQFRLSMHEMCMRSLPCIKRLPLISVFLWPSGRAWMRCCRQMRRRTQRLASCGCST